MSVGTWCAVIGTTVAALGLLSRFIWACVEGAKAWVEMSLEAALLKHRDSMMLEIQKAVGALPCRGNDPDCATHANTRDIDNLRQAVDTMGADVTRLIRIAQSKE